MPKQLRGCISSCILLLLLFTQLTGTGQTAGADSLLEFIHQNPMRSSIRVIENDRLLIGHRDQELIPLGSTSRLMIAVEFAKQAGNDILDEKSLVALSDIDKYYLPLTDGGAHEAWLKFLHEHALIHQDSVPLLQVARGMMQFSSNANTEYLMDLLGLDNINNNIKLFGLHQHTALFPVVSSLFLYQNPRKMREKKILEGIDALTEEAYCKTIFEIHKALTYDTVLKKKFNLADLTLPMQQMWNDRLTASTAKDYAQLATILNNRKFLDENSYGALSEVLETNMELPAFQQRYIHTGGKTGSTPFLLTSTIYATLRDGTKVAASLFLHDLKPAESTRLSGWLAEFNQALTESAPFRQKLQALLLIKK